MQQQSPTVHIIIAACQQTHSIVYSDWWILASVLYALAALFMNIQLVQTIPVCVPTMQVCEGGLQQLGELGSPWLSRGSVLALEVWRLLVPQLQVCQL